MLEFIATLKKISADTIAVQGALLASIILADDFSRAMDDFPTKGKFELDTIFALTGAYLALFCCFISICSIIAQVCRMNREMTSTAILNKISFLLSLCLYGCTHGIFFERRGNIIEWAMAASGMIIIGILFTTACCFPNQTGLDEDVQRECEKSASMQEALSLGSEILAAVILIDDLSRSIEGTKDAPFEMDIFFSLTSGYMALLTCLMAMINADCLLAGVIPHKAQLTFPGVTATMTIVLYTIGQAVHMFKRNSVTAFAVAIYTGAFVIITFFLIGNLDGVSSSEENEDEA